MRGADEDDIGGGRRCMRVKKSFLGMILALAVVALILMAVTAGLATHAEYDGYHDGFYYNDYEDGVQIVRIDKTGRVAIPEYIDGKPVRSVAAIDYDEDRYYDLDLYTGFVFDAPDKVTSVTLPDTLREIGDYVFLGCKRLTSVTIPDGVTKIGRAAFRDCTSLVTVKLPDTVRSIEQEAFYNCDRLSDIELPAGLTSIGNTAFHECAALKNITIPSGIKSIEGETFCGCAGLTSITIPNSVTSIGNGAFNGCGGLTSITIPNSVTSIGSGAFSRCRALSSIVIPLSVASIGSNAFNECSSLTIYAEAASRPAGWVYEGSYSNDDRWNPDDRPVVWGYSTVSNGIAYYEVSTPTGTGLGVAHVDLTGNISIPSRVNGMPVVSIGYGDDSVFADPAAISSVSLPSTITDIAADAFRNCSSLRSITIPSGVKSIGDSAFYGCSSLTSVTMSGGVTSIGSRAFYECSALTSVELSDELTSIGRSAFSGCSALAAINIPISVTSIADDAFKDCSSLTIYAEETSRPDGWVYEGNYSYDDNWNPDNRPVMWGQSYSGGLLYKKVDDGVEIVRCDYTGDVVIPSTIEGEPVVALSPTSASVFESPSQVTSVTLPASLKRASEGVFYGCTELDSVTMPVVGGEVSRFVDLFRLYSVNVPQGLTVEVIGASPIPDAMSASEGYFTGSGIKEVSIAGSVGAIGSHAFSGCTSLSTLTLQSGVTSIGTSAFEGCTSLTSLTVPSGVTSMRNNAFKGCTGLSGVRITSIAAWCGIDFESELANPLTEVHKLYNYGRLVTNLTIPSSVRSIGAYAFAGCTPLTSVTIPDSVTSIAPTAFLGCSAIEKATMPVALMSAVPKEALRTVVLTSGIALADNAFDGYDALVSVTLPGTMTSIGSSAFAGCASLEEIVLPAALATIGSRAFEDCTGLVSVAIPDSVTSIGQYAFSGCPAAIVWGDAPSLTSIGGYVFAEYAGTAIAVPHGVRSIAGYAFNNCAALTSVTIPDSVTAIGQYAFSGCPEISSLVVDDANLIYHSAGNCIIETAEKELAFGCKTSIIPSDGSVTAIGSHAFDGCSGLTSINIPNGITSIKTYAFRNCSDLISIALPGSIVSIGAYAFDDCVGLTQVSTDGLAAWCGISFGNATANPLYYAHDLYIDGEKLIELVIPDGVTSIKGYIFYNCTSLTSVTIPDSVTNIGSSAFSGCTAIQKAEMPSHVIDDIPKSSLNTVVITSGDSIGKNAFYNCTSLTSVSLPDSIKSIGGGAFKGCSSLQSLVMPETVANIGEGVLSGCRSLISVTIPFVGEAIDDSSLTGFGYLFGATHYSQNATYVPSSLREVIITAATQIGYRDFSGCSGLTSITIPSSVTEIGDYAFEKCSGLEEVHIGDVGVWCGIDFGEEDTTNPLYYANELYLNDKLITDLVIPTGVKRIESRAFNNCSELISVTMPGSVKDIGENAFSNCNNLSAVYIADISAWCNIKFWNEKANPLYYAHDLYLGDELVKEIVVASDLNPFALYNCSSLISVEIQSGVDIIGKDAFYGCVGLQELRIADIAKWCCMTFDSAETNPLYYAHNLYLDGGLVTDLVIPVGVASISDHAFNGCTSLRSVTLHAGVTDIGSDAFSMCSALTAVYIADLTAWCGIDFENEVANPLYYAHNLYLGEEKLTELVLPEGVVSIGDYAFTGCSSLTLAIISESVTAVGDHAFAGCTSLTIHAGPISIPSGWSATWNPAECPVVWGRGYADGFVYDKSSSGVTIIQSSLTGEVVIPDSFYNTPVVSIWPSGALFTAPAEVTSIIMPDSITYIKYGSLNGCGALESIVLPFVGYMFDSTSKSSSRLFGYIFGDSAYSGGVKIEQEYTDELTASYYIPAALRSVTVLGGNIGYGAFYNCTTITSITIGNVDGIQLKAFYGCDNLSEVHVLDIAVWCGISGLGNIMSSARTLYIGDRKVEGDLVIPDGVTSISASAFLGCSSLNSVTIPDSVTHISSSAFSGCSGLTSVTIPDSVMSIGSSAFSGCSNLTEVHITDLAAWCGIDFGSYEANPLYLAHALYLGRELVTDLIIPAGVESIADYVFAGCSSLTSVFVPDEVTSIGEGAFKGCDALETMTLPFIGASRDAEYYNAVFGYIFGYDTYNTWNSTTNTSSDSFINTKLGEMDDAIWQYTCRNYPHNYGGYRHYGNRSYYYFIPPSLRKVVITDAYYVSTAAFNGCSMLSEITLNHGIAEIYDYAFYNCVNLTTVNIPAGVTAIGDHAFSGCSALPSIELPSSIINIGDNVFDYCESLGTITVDEGSLNYHSAGNCLIKTSDKILLAGGNAAVIPSDGSVTSIAAYAFSGRSGLVSVTIPSGVEKIGEYAFVDCGALVSIMIPDSVTSLGSGLLSGCGNLETITLPFIGNKAGITSGSEYQYPLGYIFGKDYYAGGVGTKQTYKFGSSTTTQTYYIPKSLRSVTVTGGEILQGAFYNCSMLTTVTIPESVTSIGSEAFYNCKNLSEVSFKGTMAEWDEVSKGVNWNSSCSFAVVKCSDGDVAVR